MLTLKFMHICDTVKVLTNQNRDKNWHGPWFWNDSVLCLCVFVLDLLCILCCYVMMIIIHFPDNSQVHKWLWSEDHYRWDRLVFGPECQFWSSRFLWMPREKDFPLATASSDESGWVQGQDLPQHTRACTPILCTHNKRYKYSRTPLNWWSFNLVSSFNRRNILGVPIHHFISKFKLV